MSWVVGAFIVVALVGVGVVCGVCGVVWYMARS